MKTIFRYKKLSLGIAWYDFWIGVFWDQKKRVLYICLFPCIVLRIGKPKKKNPLMIGNVQIKVDECLKDGEFYFGPPE